MRKFEMLPHVADVRIKIEADNLPELFVAALEGMMQIIKESATRNQELGIKRIVQMQSVDKTALLIDFLNEVLYQAHTNKEVYREMKFLEFSETVLKAEIYGEKVEQFDEDIKAVTYHEADIIKDEKGNFKTIIVFDI